MVVHDGVVAERPATRADEYAGKPGVVRFLELQPRPFVMIGGEGGPGEATFAPRLPGLYATAYSLHFALKRRGIEERVGPLEGLWWTVDPQRSLDDILDDDRAGWRWTLMIGIPSQASTGERERALATGRAKAAAELASDLRIEVFDEGTVAQVLHLGSYAEERPSIELLHRAVRDAGLQPTGRHHEIYLGDPRRARPDRLRTLIRQPVAPAR